VTARPAPRRNREGHPCSPWRATGHDEVYGAAEPFGFHGSAPAGIRLGGDSVGARVMRDSTWHGRPSVLVSGLDRAADPALRAGPRCAKYLAGLAEMLAGAFPDQHRELAGAIRAAAATIAAGTPEPTCLRRRGSVGSARRGGSSDR
jgi:hypothetical protein